VFRRFRVPSVAVLTAIMADSRRRQIGNMSSRAASAADGPCTQGAAAADAHAPSPVKVAVAIPQTPEAVKERATPNKDPTSASNSSWRKLLHISPTVIKLVASESPVKSTVKMSWAGFKKNVNRAATQVMVKTGHVEQTHDRSYEVEERRYRVMENAATRLQKESKGYLDSLRAMTASQMRIAETIDAFYGDAGANDGVSRSYKQAVEDLDAETIKALDGPFRSTVLDPINRFCAYFPDINECKS